MTRQVVVTLTARRELDELVAYIAAEQVDAARRLLGSFGRFVATVREHPQVGVEVRPNVRRWIIADYRVVVFYRAPDDEPVQVLRVLHGTRSLEAVLDEILEWRD